MLCNLLLAFAWTGLAGATYETQQPEFAADLRQRQPCDVPDETAARNASGPNTCVVNSSFHSRGDLHIAFDGDVVITTWARLSAAEALFINATGTISVSNASLRGGDVSLTAASINLNSTTVKSSRGNISIDASVANCGAVHASEGTSITAAVDVGIVGSKIFVDGGVSIKSEGMIYTSDAQVTSNFLATDCQPQVAISGTGVSLESHTISLGSGKGNVSVSCDVSFSTTHRGSVDITAENISVAATVVTDLVLFQATGNVEWTNPKPVATKTAPEVKVIAAGSVRLGGYDEDWLARSLHVFGSDVNLTVQSFNCNEKMTCRHERSAVRDRCTAAITNLTVDPTDEDGNVTFDFALVARDSLHVGAAQITAASMLLCSGGTAALDDKLQLDATGRGCGPGQGMGRGESRDPRVGCGSGGGSHLGLGGRGSGGGMIECAAAGMSYDRYVDFRLLPTKGASGGGCGKPDPCDFHGILQAPLPGVPTVPVPGVPRPPSTGGGLIWLSAQSWKLGAGVVVTADGNEGIFLPVQYYPWPSTGGGAGGAVIFLGEEVVGQEGEPVHISARGGNAVCGQASLSGAGGGGFVAMMVRGDNELTTEEIVAPWLLVADVRGGVVGDDCREVFPVSTISQSLGNEGQVSSFERCAPGHHGIFCLPCEAGTWSDGGVWCESCHNKPEDGSYTEEGWPNATCPYICAPFMPNVASNEFCLDPLNYALSHLGGPRGLLSMFLTTCAVLVFLLVRPRLQKYSRGCKLLFIRLVGGSEAARHSVVSSELDFLGGCGHCSFLWVLCCRRRRGPCTAPRFTKEQLPHHVCRVYLGGHNTRHSPWFLSARVPSNVATWLDEDSWQAFVGEVSELAAVPKKESLIHRFLSIAHPPFAGAYALHRRLARAEKLVAHVHNLASSATGSDAPGAPFLKADACWRSQATTKGVQLGGSMIMSAARGHTGQSSLAVRFGHDGGATLGYLDFLDFSRSPLDWAPADLRREALLLVAHGHGTFSEPLALDVMDPQVHHAALTEVGARELCHLVAVFNRVARLLPLEELDMMKQYGAGPTFSYLRAEVERWAAHFGLNGLAHVIVLEQPHPPAEHRFPNHPSGSHPRNGPLDASQDTVQVPPARPSQELDRLADLISNDTLQGVPSGGASSSHQAASSTQFDWRRQAPGVTPTTAHLCLALADCRQPSSAAPRRPVVVGTRGSSDTSVALSSPREQVLPSSPRSPGQVAPGTLVFMPPRRLLPPLPPEPMPASVTLDFPLACPCQETWDLLQSLASGAHPAAAAATPSTRWSWQGWRKLQQRACMTWHAWARSLPAAVLCLIAMLWLADLLAFCLLSIMLLDMSALAFTVYLLCPPLVQPLSLLLGPVFLLIEVPRVGRLWATFCKVGTVGPLGCAVILFWRLHKTSYAFEFLELMTICAFKLTLAACVSAHVQHVETAADHAFGARDEESFRVRQQADRLTLNAIPASVSGLTAAAGFGGH